MTHGVCRVPTLARSRQENVHLRMIQLNRHLPVGCLDCDMIGWTQKVVSRPVRRECDRVAMTYRFDHRGITSIA